MKINIEFNSEDITDPEKRDEITRVASVKGQCPRPLDDGDL